MLQMQRDSNQKVLNQIHYNMISTDNTIKQLALSTFSDNLMVSLSYSRQISIEDLVPKLLRLNQTVNSTPFLHSIVVYNQLQEKYYSTEYNPTKNMIRQIEDRLVDTDSIPKLRLVRMSPDIFSYFLCEQDACGLKNAFMVFNVRAEWLFQNIYQINRLAYQESEVFVTDSTGSSLVASDQSNQPDEAMLTVIQQYLSQSELTESSAFTEVVNGEKMYISMTKTLHEWVVVSTQPHSSVFGTIDQLKVLVVIMTVVLLLIALFISVMVSRKLYKPIAMLYQQVSRDHLLPARTSRKDDEISLLAKAYAQIAQREYGTNRDIVKNYHLISFIQDSCRYDATELEAIIREHRLQLDPGGRYGLVLLCMDDYQAFLEDPYFADRELFRFATMNIGQEVFGKQFKTELIDIQNDRFVALMNIPDDINAAATLESSIEEFQVTVKHLYRISLTAVIGNAAESFRGVTASYESAASYSQYRIVLGKGSIIKQELVQANLEHRDQHIPLEYKDKLEQAMKSGDYESLNVNLSQLFKLISQYSYKDMIECVMQVVFIMHTAIVQMNQNKLQPLHVDLKEFSRQVLEKETLAEMEMMFLELSDQLKDKSLQLKNSRTQVLIDSIRAMIDSNYADDQLSVQSIADQFKMSPVYLGQIYKENEHLSIADYITEVRMKHAVELLANSNYSIKNVIEKVGFTNESHFYKMFKKTFGVTPNELRLRKSIQ